jgi:hypothetical protein
MKDLKKLIKAAARAGWRVEKRRKHFRWFAPDGVSQATTSATTSDHRALKNIRGDLRRAGLAV